MTDNAKFSEKTVANTSKNESKSKTRTLTPIKAIRAKCLDCSGNSAAEVRECVLKHCPLYPYRMGRNPNRTGRELTEEQKAKCAAALARAREARAM